MENIIIPIYKNTFAYFSEFVVTEKKNCGFVKRYDK